MVGIVFQELLANPCLAQSYTIGNHHAVIASQNLAGLLNSILLKFT